MKVLLLANNLQGLYSFRKEVVEAIIEASHSVVISVPKAEEDLVKYFEDKGCIVINTTIDRRGVNPIKDLHLILEYRKLLKTHKPNVVLSYTIKPNLYGGMMCRMLGIPQIANITGLGTAVENKGILQKLTILLYKIGLKKAAMTFFQNEENRDFCLSKGMVNESNKLIPGSGVNLQRFKFCDLPKDDVIKFIFISRLMKQKGIDEYLGAAKIIKQKYQNTEFHVLGKNEKDYSEIIEEYHNNGTVIYHGTTSDVTSFIKQVHCTIHPTFYPEGMSNVLLESCATGRAIITTNRSGCREIVDNGINGYIVNQQDVDDLVSKIEAFINLPFSEKLQMGIEARKKVERSFDRKIVITEYLNAIKLFAHN